MEDKVYTLVKEQFEKMTLSNINSNQVILTNKCQDIISNDWSVRNQKLWDLVNKYVKEFIPDEMD